MGKRSAVGELFLGNMGSIQWETRPSIQREDQLTMETQLEQIAAKCCEPTVEERSAVNPHATFCGNRRRVTASGDPVASSTTSNSTVRLPSVGTAAYPSIASVPFGCPATEAVGHIRTHVSQRIACCPINACREHTRVSLGQPGFAKALRQQL